MLWTASAAALPVIVSVLVLAALTLAVLVFTGRGFDTLFAVVAVEWLVINRVPLTVDEISLGFLPLLPALLYVAVLGRQTRAVLSDLERPGPREAGAAVAGATLAGLLLTGLASLLVASAASDFAVREESLPLALAWTAAVGIVGSGLGVWMYFRRDLREILPLWVRGGIHLGTAFVAATWALTAALVLVGVIAAWGPVAGVLEIGRSVVGTAALAAISVAYLPNMVVGGAALAVGGEAHLGQASYSVFAVSRGPMPEVPLAAVLPTTTPHWAVQGLLLVTVLLAAALARSVAHWFRTTADAVKAAWLAAAIVALVMALSPVVAGGELGLLGTVGTGSLIAALTALALFGVIGSATIALSLAGLTRRRERAESELRRRRRTVGTVAEPMPHAVPDDDAVDDRAVDDRALGVDTPGVDTPGVVTPGVDTPGGDTFGDGALDDGARDDGPLDDGARDDEPRDDEARDEKAADSGLDPAADGAIEDVGDGDGAGHGIGEDEIVDAGMREGDDDSGTDGRPVAETRSEPGAESEPTSEQEPDPEAQPAPEGGARAGVDPDHDADTRS